MCCLDLSCRARIQGISIIISYYVSALLPWYSLVLVSSLSPETNRSLVVHACYVIFALSHWPALVVKTNKYQWVPRQKCNKISASTYLPHPAACFVQNFQTRHRPGVMMLPHLSPRLGSRVCTNKQERLIRTFPLISYLIMIFSAAVEWEEMSSPLALLSLPLP